MRGKLLALFSIFFIFYIFPFKAFAQTPVPISPIPTPSTQDLPSSDIPNNLHTRSQSVVIELLAAISCQLSGVDPINPDGKCLGIDIDNKKIGYVESNGGAIGLMNNMIVHSFQVPVSSSQYFADLSSNFGITKNAYAQKPEGSIGWMGLRMVLEVWKTFSNIVYFFFVLLFLIIGLGIMMRIKIDPRTVMTFQNQIPKIIITMILVFFSYAIAGILVDFMWVSIYFIYGTLIKVNGVKGLDTLNPANIQGDSIFGAIGKITGINEIAHPAALGVKDVVQNLIGAEGCDGISGCIQNVFNPFKIFALPFFNFSGGKSTVEYIYDLISFAIAGGAAVKASQFIGTDQFLGFSAGTPSKIAAGATGFMAAYPSTQWFLRSLLPYLIVYIVIFIALFMALFRLWFELLRSYIYIILGVLLAPFWIAFGLVPGSTLGFGPWFKSLLAYLAVYPTTYFMLMIAYIINQAYTSPLTNKNTVFVPPFIGNQNNINGMGAIISMMIILITPQVVNIVKDAIKAPSLKYTSAIGQGLGAGPGVIRGAGSTAMAYHTPRIGKGGGWVTGGIPGILGKLLH